jgi:hypothetical protein
MAWDDERGNGQGGKVADSARACIMVLHGSVAEEGTTSDALYALTAPEAIRAEGAVLGRQRAAYALVSDAPRS